MASWNPVSACVLALVLLLSTEALAALPQPVLREGPALRQVGDGQLTFMGLRIYHASLWTSDGRFDNFAAGEPVALSLWYDRGFSREELLRIVDTAWRRLGEPSEEDRAQWLSALGTKWRDVERGDNLTTVVVPGQGTRFYDEQQLLGEIADPDFGPAFLSIWLHPRSVVSELRVQLLGLDRPRLSANN